MEGVGGIARTLSVITLVLTFICQTNILYNYLTSPDVIHITYK